MEMLNLGILAHVDAGKTSLTERILFEAGVIRSIGSVDKGTTQTDTMELERARGITIKSAVVAFRLGDLQVNLIDTPGHADFVAEVERSLLVLDAVVLVISAVEGVQPQTRRLARAIRAAGLPLAIFINKIDRLGARSDALLDDIRQKLNLRVLPLTHAAGLGERSATVEPWDRGDPIWRDPAIDLLAESSERVIAEFDRTGGDLSPTFIDVEIREQIAAGTLTPAFFGSAITGAGVSDLLDGISRWIPRAAVTSDIPLSGSIFKIARRPTGEPLVYARLFGGELAVRQRIPLSRRDVVGETVTIEERVTAIDRFASGTASQGDAAVAGEIVVLHGLHAARIGDWIGVESGTRRLGKAFPAPALESVVRVADLGQIMRLRTALEQLAEQDPLISLRQRNAEGEISVRLFGEVQKEVLTDTLANEYGVAVTFDASQTICVERPLGTGEAVEVIFEGENPFHATIGFCVEPDESGNGIRYDRELGSLPLAYYRAIEETVYETLSQGLRGWEVTACHVTLTHAGYSAPTSTAADFRKLTPLVLMNALQAAGTDVCEPIEEMEIELPEDAFGAVCGLLINARAVMRNVLREGASHRIVCEIPTVEIRGVEQQLPGLTRGEGSWISHVAGFVPVTGELPARQRFGPNPLNRAHYLAEVARS